MTNSKFCIVLIIFICLCGCGSSYDVKELKSLANHYTINQAKKDGCLVMEEGTITSGQDVFDAFLKSTHKNEKAQIRIVNSYTDDEESQLLFIADVVFKNGKYITYSYENKDEQLYTQKFKYMIKDDVVGNPEALYTKGSVYILVNDASLSYDEIMKAILSSTQETGKEDLSHFFIYQKFED